MDMFGTFFQLVGDLYTFPLEQYEYSYYGESDDRDWVATIVFGSVIYGITALFVIPIMFWLGRYIMWLIKRRHCQHCSDWTMDYNQDEHPGCTQDQACCIDCTVGHEDDDRQRQAETEPRIICPIDNVVMDKVVNHDIGLVQDVCGGCGAVLLDKGEQEIVNSYFELEGYNRGYRHGRSSSTSSNLAVGIAIGSVIS